MDPHNVTGYAIMEIDITNKTVGRKWHLLFPQIGLGFKIIKENNGSSKVYVYVRIRI